MKNSWPNISISEISENLDSKRIPVSKSKRKSGNIPYYGATGIVDYVDDYIFDEELLLIGEDGADWSGGANTAFIINGKSWVNNHAHVLRIKDDANIQFVMNYLNYSDLRNYISGTTRGKLNQASLNKIIVPSPPIKTQQRVANILSSVDDAIQKTDQIIQKAEKLKQGLMRELFATGKNWKKARLGDVTKFIDYRGKTPKKVTFGITLITAKNVRMGYVETEPQEFIRTEDYDSWMTRGIPNIGDVLFTTEAPLGNVAQLETRGKVAFAQRVIIIQPMSGLQPSFLKYLLMSNEFQEKIHSFSTGGTVKGVKAKMLKQINIPIPETEEQVKISEILRSVDVKISMEKENKKRLQNLKKGLMQDIFSQKVGVN